MKLEPGWYKITHPSRVPPFLEKAICVPEEPNRLVTMLIEQDYSFEPVHVLTEMELVVMTKTATEEGYTKGVYSKEAKDYWQEETAG
jgi:hypothetical protein